MDLVQCQFMTVIIILLVINIGLVIGVFLKWNAARKYCKGGAYKARIYSNTDTGNFMEDNTTTTEEYPFVIGIIVSEQSGFGSELHCGGVIIGNYWVLTAGHCVDMLKSLSPHNIIITGGSTLWKISVHHQVDFMINHNAYNNISFNNDIGLIKVKQPFTDAFEKQIATAGKSYRYVVNRTVRAVGWSGSYYKEEYRAHDVLSSVGIDIFDQQYCKSLYKEIGEEISESMFCADSYGGEKAACHLDSGAPVLDGDLLIGIVSWGKDCGKVDQPAVYTRISAFEEWIYDILGSK